MGLPNQAGAEFMMMVIPRKPQAVRILNETLGPKGEYIDFHKGRPSLQYQVPPNVWDANMTADDKQDVIGQGLQYYAWHWSKVPFDIVDDATWLMKYVPTGHMLFEIMDHRRVYVNLRFHVQFYMSKVIECPDQIDHASLFHLWNRYGVLPHILRFFPFLWYRLPEIYQTRNNVVAMISCHGHMLPSLAPRFRCDAGLALLAVQSAPWMIHFLPSVTRQALSSHRLWKHAEAEWDKISEFQYGWQIPEFWNHYHSY